MNLQNEPNKMSLRSMAKSRTSERLSVGIHEVVRKTIKVVEKGC